MTPIIVLPIAIILFLLGLLGVFRFRSSRYGEAVTQDRCVETPEPGTQVMEKYSQSQFQIQKQSDQMDVDQCDAEERVLLSSDSNVGQCRPTAPLLAIHLMAEKDQLFLGYELLQALLSVGLRYGQSHIFYRNTEVTGQGALCFYVTSVAHPGTFDLSNIGAFSTSGLSLFFKADAVADPLLAYELMLQTVGELLDELGGEVLDNQRQRLTADKVAEQRGLLHCYLAEAAAFT